MEKIVIDPVIETIALVLHGIAALSDRERNILLYRFGIFGKSPLSIKADTPKTLNETGKRFFVTRERIHQIEAKALRKIKMRILYRDKQ